MDLIDRFLAGQSERTRQAYASDLVHFAQFVGEPLEVAVARLLAGEVEAGKMALEYAADLRRRNVARATISRRLSTLGALVEMAGAGWSLVRPTEDDWNLMMVTKGDHPYLLPRHPSEIDRLDLQHYAIGTAIGVNYLAPLDSPRRILDVGSGTGQWGFEMCAHFPDAEVVGLDLDHGKPNAPANYRFVRGDLRDGLPFGDDQFDFVHQRLMFVAIPAAGWPSLVAELVRVTRSGGWVELVEPPFMGFEPMGPALERVAEIAVQLSASRGLDTESVVFGSIDRYLRDVGLRGVNRREVNLPIGEWGGPVGRMMAVDCRASFARILEVLTSLSPEQRDELLRELVAEFEKLQVGSKVAFAFGRNPL